MLRGFLLALIVVLLGVVAWLTWLALDGPPAPTPAPPPPSEVPEAPTEPTPPPPPPKPVEPDPPWVPSESYLELWDEYVNEKQGFPFKDLSHWVDPEELDDTRWRALHWDRMQVERGTQLVMSWSRARSEHPWDIQVRIEKSIHMLQRGGSITTFSMPFDHIGKSIRTSRYEDLAEAYYEDWKKSATDVIEEECRGPKKRRLRRSRIKGLYAYATGTDAETRERERRAWFIWLGPNVTWVATVRYRAAVLQSEELIEKGEDLLNSIDELDEDWERE